MEGAAGGFISRSFESMIKECPGNKYASLQKAIQTYQVEGLIDTFLSLFRENKAKDLKLETNGFCQLMFEGLLLEQACESATESIEHPGHHHRSTRGSEDATAEDRQHVATISTDDLLVQSIQ